MVPYSWKRTSQRKLFQWDFCSFIFVSKREKEALSSSQSMTLCALFSYWNIILSWEADVHESQSTIVKVWGAKSTLRRLCKTQDLISIVHPFTHCSSFQASGMWVFNYLQISYYLYSIFVYYFCLLYLFVLLFNFRSVYCSFYFITSVNCWKLTNKFFILFFLQSSYSGVIDNTSL